MRLRLRIALVSLLTLCCTAVVHAGETPAGLAAASEAFRANLALGDSLAGDPASAADVAEARRLADEALSHVRSCLEEDPNLPAAHHLCGMVVCTCYLPVTVERGDPSDQRPSSEDKGTTILRRRPQNAEEGLAELRKAVSLAPHNYDFQLDCSEALGICGHDAGAREHALGVWKKASGPSPVQRTRAARLLSAAARGAGQPRDEAQWLRKVLLLDPENSDAAHRLVQLEPTINAGIAWEPYAAGMAVAGHERKPVLLDFRAPWCGWCTKLVDDVFADPAVIALSRHFVCIEVEATIRRDLAEQYRIRSLPQAVLLDRSGKEVHRILGYKPVRSYLAEMRRGLAGG